MLIGLMLAAAAPAVEAPLIPAFFTGERLYSICTRPNHGTCSMYVAGVLDGIFLTRSKLGAAALCPAKINNREAGAIVLDYLENHPDLREHAAAVVVRKAMAEKLDCDGPQEIARGTR